MNNDDKQFEVSEVSDSECPCDELEVINKPKKPEKPEKPKLCIFGWKKKQGYYETGERPFYVKDYSEATKFLLYSLWKKEECLNNKTLDEIEKDLLEMDWLTFYWGSLPEFIFRDIFRSLPDDCLMFFAGHFGTYYGESMANDRNNKTKIVDSLWNYFSNDYLQNYCNH